MMVKIEVYTHETKEYIITLSKSEAKDLVKAIDIANSKGGLVNTICYELREWLNDLVEGRFNVKT